MKFIWSLKHSMHTATRSLKNEKWNSSHSSGPARLCLQYWVQFWFPQFKGRIRLERVQRKVTKMFKGLLNLSHEEILKALGSFSQGREGLMGGLITVVQYLKRVKVPSSEGATQKTKSNHTSCTGRGCIPRKKLLYNKSQKSLWQYPQWCGRVSITGHFQDMIGQAARYSHLDS